MGKKWSEALEQNEDVSREDLKSEYDRGTIDAAFGNDYDPSGSLTERSAYSKGYEEIETKREELED